MGGTIATSPFRINTIEFVTIAQTGNSVDFGDLTLLMVVVLVSPTVTEVSKYNYGE